MSREPPPAPRTPPLFPRRATPFLVASLVAAAMTAAVVGVANAAHDADLLDRRGVEVRGAAVHVTDQRSSPRSGPSRWTGARIEVSFDDGKGAPRLAWVTTSSAAIAEVARANGPIDIDYDPEAPARARLHGAPPPTPLPPFVALAVVAWGAVILLGREVAKARALYRGGVPARADVTRFVPGSVFWRRAPRVHYRFDVGDERVSGVASLPWMTRNRRIERIWIYYDPKNPKDSVPARA
ncbi:MAG TPA: hypothetical protein VGM56_33810 [Byssovorax sp.]